MAASDGPVDAARVAALGRALEQAVARAVGAGEPCTVLFSGGVDSGLIAALAFRRGRPELLTVGVPGSADLAAVSGLTGDWARALRRVEVGSEEIVQVEARVEEALGGATSIDRSVAVSFAVALSHTSAGPVLVGQGADELFLGYAHFRGLRADAALARSEADLEALVDGEWPRARRIGRLLGIEPIAPFLDAAVIAESRRFTAEERLPGAHAKRPLRSLARSLGVPESICGRPKKALQYGTGVDRVLRRRADARS